MFGTVSGPRKLGSLVGKLLIAPVAAPGFFSQFVLHAAPTPVGKVEAGKTFWQAQMCQYCHGVQAEGVDSFGALSIHLVETHLLNSAVWLELGDNNHTVGVVRMNDVAGSIIQSAS